MSGSSDGPEDQGPGRSESTAGGEDMANLGSILGIPLDSQSTSRDSSVCVCVCGRGEITRVTVRLILRSRNA